MLSVSVEAYAYTWILVPGALKYMHNTFEENQNSLKILQANHYDENVV